MRTNRKNPILPALILGLGLGLLVVPIGESRARDEAPEDPNDGGPNDVDCMHCEGKHYYLVRQCNGQRLFPDAHAACLAAAAEHYRDCLDQNNCRVIDWPRPI